MDSLNRTLATLTGQGWQIRQHGHRWVVLSRPYPNPWHLRSWDIGVMVASLILLCVAARLPPGGTALLSVAGMAGMVWSVISMILWRRPVHVMRLWYGRDGAWHQSKPVLKKT